MELGSPWPAESQLAGTCNYSYRREGSLLGAQYQIGLVSRGRDGPWQVTRALKRKEPKQGLQWSCDGFERIRIRRIRHDSHRVNLLSAIWHSRSELRFWGGEPPGVTYYENGVERWNRACNSQNARGYCGCGACNFCAHFWEGAAGGSREPCRTTTALPLLRGGGGGTRRRCCGPPDGPPRALPAPPP